MRIMAFKSILGAIVLTTAALSTHPAKAETRLNVPFSFTVSGQTMPAGVYTVQEDAIHSMVRLRTRNASKSFAYALQPGDPVPDSRRVTLKFENAGESHILRSIQIGSRMTSRLDNGRAPVAFEPGRLSQGR